VVASTKSTPVTQTSTDGESRHEDIGPTREISVSEARDALAEMVNRVAYSHERVALTRRGRTLAVLVSVEDLKKLEALEK